MNCKWLNGMHGDYSIVVDEDVYYIPPETRLDMIRIPKPATDLKLLAALAKLVENLGIVEMVLLGIIKEKKRKLK